MAPDQRGVLAFFVQMSYVVTTLSILGVERPYVAERTGTSFPIAVSELGHLMKWIWVGGLLLSLVGAMTAWRLDWLTALMCITAAAYVISNAAVRKVRIAYIVSNDRRIFLVNIILVQGVLLILGIILHSLHVDSPAVWLGAYAGSSALALVTVMRSSRSAAKDESSAKRLRRVRREGLRLLPASLGNTALLRSDRLMMPFLSSPAELGVYVTVGTVMEVGAWPIQQWVDASLGRLRNSSHNNRRQLALRLFIGAVLLTTAIGLLAFFTITLILPPEYQRSLELIPILGAGTVVYAMTRLQHGWLIAEGRPGTVSVAETVGLCASAVLYVCLIPILGALGAAVGTFAGHCILCGTTYLLGRASGNSGSVNM